MITRTENKDVAGLYCMEDEYSIIGCVKAVSNNR